TRCLSDWSSDVCSSDLHAQLVLIAVGELLAGGISMGLGGYLSARTERDILEQRIAIERFEIAHEPDEEKAELRRIYYEKGVRGEIGRASCREGGWGRGV